MREIKFRAWDKWKNKMIAPHDGDFIKWHAMSNWRDCLEVMQFTGLKDRNGVEIYEGDILAIDGDIIAPVTFEGGGFMIIALREQGRSPLIQDRAKRMEIVGNIYQHSHLLDSGGES